MYKKLCDWCKTASYSSRESGEWHCPSCYKDITHLKLWHSEEVIDEVVTTTLKSKQERSHHRKVKFLINTIERKKRF